MTEIVLKVALSTIALTPNTIFVGYYFSWILRVHSMCSVHTYFKLELGKTNLTLPPFMPVRRQETGRPSICALFPLYWYLFWISFGTDM